MRSLTAGALQYWCHRRAGRRVDLVPILIYYHLVVEGTVGMTLLQKIGEASFAHNMMR